MRTKHTRTVAALLLTAFLFVAATALHHGWSNYDQESPMNVTGVITEASYENPHGMIDLEVAEDSAWTVVLAPPSRMQNRGLAAEMLAEGATAEVLAYPHKEGKAEMRAEWIILDGDTTQLR